VFTRRAQLTARALRLQPVVRLRWSSQQDVLSVRDWSVIILPSVADYAGALLVHPCFFVAHYAGPQSTVVCCFLLALVLHNSPVNSGKSPCVVSVDMLTLCAGDADLDVRARMLSASIVASLSAIDMRIIAAVLGRPSFLQMLGSPACCVSPCTWSVLCAAALPVTHDIVFSLLFTGLYIAVNVALGTSGPAACC
jgi:hypothetical protein